MFLNSWRLRLGAIGAGAVLLLFVYAMTGTLFPGSRPGILIEFGSDPETFAGLPVEIDGKVAGKLERFGQATRTGFEVAGGTHTVRVVHPTLDCRPVTVDAKLPGIKTMLLLEYDDGVDASGRMKPRLVLRPS
jgi:hypothetical protein